MPEAPNRRQGTRLNAFPLTKISQRPYLLGNLQPLVVANGRLLRLVSFVAILLPKIAFEGDKNEFHAWAVFGDLGDPFCLDVLE